MKTNRLIHILLTGLILSFVYTAKAQPTWSVDAHQYMYSMTITGKIFSNESYSTDVNDIVGAFVNDECRGVANVKYIPSVNSYFVFLMVYSNSPTDNVTFRIFDKSINLETSVKETARFSVNDNLGTSLNPFIFTASNLNNMAEIQTFSIPFQQGNTSIVGEAITLKENWSGNLKGIAPSFTLSSGAKAFINGIEQFSGVTVNDFDKAVQYTIQSEDHKVTSVYTVTITTANDIPTDILLSGSAIDENDGPALIGNLTAVTENPAEIHVFSLVDGISTFNDYFQIIGNQLFSTASFNYESNSGYPIKVRADDQKGGVVEKLFTITVNDLNEAPTSINLINMTTPILASANIEVATLIAIDPDADDSHTFSLQTGNGINDKDNGLFKIVGNKLKSNVSINFRKGDKYGILVKAVDREGASVVVPLSIQTQNVESLSNQSKLLTFTINQQIGETVISGTNVYVKQHFAGNLNLARASFTISPGAFAYVNSVKQVSGISVNNFTNSTSFVVEAADKTTTTYTIHATVNNDIPTDILLSNNNVDENLSSSMVGKLTTVTENPNDVHLYSLVNEPGNDIAYFKIEGSDLKTANMLDYENKSSYLVKVRADDQKGGTVEKSLTITINDVNEAPTAISLSNQSLAIGMQENALIGELTAQDPDAVETHVFSLVKGNGINDEGNDLVRISGNKLLLTKPINYLVKMNWNILIKVSDHLNQSFEESFTLSTSVQGINNSPVFASKPINYVMQNEVYVYSIEVTDLDNDPVSFSFENLPNWLKYYPELGLLTGSPNNDEVGTFSFNVIANDNKASAVQKVDLMVLNINDPPEINYFLQNQVFVANMDNQFVIPVDCFVDPDQGDFLTYSVSMGNNTALPSWLSIDRTNGIIKGNPPKQALGTYQIKLTATDQKKSREWMIFNLEVTVPTAVSEINVTDIFQVYPNPVNDFLNLKFSGYIKNATLEISDTKGEIIRKIEFEGNSKSIYLGDLPSGVYFVSLLNDKSKEIKKIIKK